MKVDLLVVTLDDACDLVLTMAHTSVGCSVEMMVVCWAGLLVVALVVESVD